MTYAAPFINASGLNESTYTDIENYLVSQAQTAFGADIYLGSDSQDFQFIAAIAQLAYDTLLASQLAYNNRTPTTAVGVALDELVALNGLSRFQPTKSVVTLTLTGSAFAVINNGVVGDSNGNTWVLPSSVTIGSGGTVSVTATAQSDGSITAEANTITKIQTPQFGWTSVTNPNPASPGQGVESDAALKQRQAISTAAPTQAITTGIKGAVLNLPLVAEAQLYENDTNAPLSSINGANNSGGFPAHSITLVVTGGDDTQIANTIANRKTPGCYTNGTTLVNITDITGTVTPIRFYRPTDQEIDATVTVSPLAGYNDAVRDAGKKALVDYINNLPAGRGIVISELWQAVLNSDKSTSPTFSLRSITAGLHMGTQSTNDIPLDFNINATSEIDDIDWVFP